MSHNWGDYDVRREFIPRPHELASHLNVAPFPTDAYIASDLAEGGLLCHHGKGLVVTRIGFVRFMWPRLVRRTG
jgi:hypothetical protein